MNRYLNEPMADMPHRNGSHVRVVLRKPKIFVNQPYLTYRASAADLLWTLADRHYGDSTDWWVLADMNRHIFCPDDLQWGTSLNIPIGR